MNRRSAASSAPPTAAGTSPVGCGLTSAALDPTWGIAAATTAELQRETDSAGETLSVTGVPQTNLLWKWLGLRPVSHTPCRFDCPETIAQADAVWALARELGFDEEIGWLTEILSWPVEWSSLHGIAEIRTPVLKICTRTDATKRRRSVRWTARDGAYPAEGARGVRFPYVTPRKPLLTVTAGYRRGLENTSANGTRSTSVASVDPLGPSEILGEVLVTLETEGMIDGRSIQTVSLTPYFTVVQLDDGHVGAAMSYYRDSESLTKVVPTPSRADPLLLDWLFHDPAPVAELGARAEQGWHLVRSLRTAVLSALSARLLRDGGAVGFEVVSVPPINPFAEARRAVVIGFGGYMDRLAEAPRIEHLHVCDLGYASRRAEMEGFAEACHSRHPQKRITFSDGSDAEARIKASDLLAITGSALCNGTMERLLSYARGGPVVVVQGQSASVHPRPFFRRGVQMVATTLKPPELAAEAAADPSGQRLRPFLEGGLPWVYLVPSTARAARIPELAALTVVT